MALPTAAIICIVLACWVLVVLILFALYQLLKSRGSCSCECAPCGKEESGGCCQCCISLSDSCNCCNPSVNGCLNKICPGQKKVSCVDLLLCQCCAGEGEESCCLKILPSCGCCETDCCNSECCRCCADCEAVVCCCLEIRLVSKTDALGDMQTMPSGKYTSEQSMASSDPGKQESKDKLELRAKTDQDDKENTRPLPVSPPSSARSVSQLILTQKTKSHKDKIVKKKVVKRVSKSQSVDISKPSERLTEVSFQDQKRLYKQRSLPETPSIANKVSTTTKPVQKSKENTSSGGESETDSELDEVAVAQQSIPLHRLNSNSVVRALSLGSLQSGSYVNFSLSDIGNSQTSMSGDSIASPSYIVIPAGSEADRTSNGINSYRDNNTNFPVSLANFKGIEDAFDDDSGSQQTSDIRDTASSRRPLPVPLRSLN